MGASLTPINDYTAATMCVMCAPSTVPGRLGVEYKEVEEMVEEI